MSVIPAAEVQRLQNALPFWLSLGMIPVAVLSVWCGLSIARRWYESENVDAIFDLPNSAIALGVVGGILILIFIVKVTIIGYYQSEFVTYLVIGIVGIALLAVAMKMRDRNVR